MIYNVQFPVLQQNEDDTWYDTTGNIVFTCSKGLTGVGLDRPVWNFSLDALKGPVFYLCSCMTGGRTAVRPGLKGVELFCGTAWWESYQPTPESFTVSVADVNFFGRCAENRRNRLLISRHLW